MHFNVQSYKHFNVLEDMFMYQNHGGTHLKNLEWTQATPFFGSHGHAQAQKIEILYLT